MGQARACFQTRSLSLVISVYLSLNIAMRRLTNMTSAMSRYIQRKKGAKKLEPGALARSEGS